jgi:hypothetical protein
MQHAIGNGQWEMGNMQQATGNGQHEQACNTNFKLEETQHFFEPRTLT